MKSPPFIINWYTAWIASLRELTIISPPFISIVPLLSESSESGSDLMPSFRLVIWIFPPFIVNRLSQAKTFFVEVIIIFPLLIIKFELVPPFISFFVFPITFNVPVPLIVKDSDILIFIPAPSNKFWIASSVDSSFSIGSLSVIVDSRLILDLLQHFSL